MGSRVPENDAFKDEILLAAEADKYRGRYLPWGGVHYWSMSLGAVCGALAIAIISLIGH
jgi:hypothetical protein